MSMGGIVLCLDTGCGYAEPGVGGAAVKSILGGSMVGDVTLDIENMKNFKIRMFLFLFFLWVELKYNSLTKRTMNNIIDEPERVEPQYNSLTNRTMNNSLVKRTLR